MRKGESMAWDKIFGRGNSAPAKGAAPESATAGASAADANAPEAKRNRRSKRVYISMRVLVKFQRDGKPHEEQALSEAVNAHGCLLRLSVAPGRGQTLILVNLGTTEQAECRVAYLGHSEAGKVKVGIEFLKPAENFWRIAFPPDDWNATDFSDGLPERAAANPTRKTA